MSNLVSAKGLMFNNNGRNALETPDYNHLDAFIYYLDSKSGSIIRACRIEVTKFPPGKADKFVKTTYDHLEFSLRNCRTHRSPLFRDYKNHNGAFILLSQSTK